MAARSDALTFPRGLSIGRRRVWILSALVAAAAAVVVTVSLYSGSGKPAQAPAKVDPGVTSVTGTGPGLATIGAHWDLAGQDVPAISGTGPDLQIASQIAAAKAAAAAAEENARAAIQHRKATGAVRGGGAPTPAMLHTRQLVP